MEILLKITLIGEMMVEEVEIAVAVDLEVVRR
jgi:hypothetical protein